MTEDNQEAINEQAKVQVQEQEDVPTPEAQAQPEQDELSAVRAQLQEAEAKSAEYLDGWQRARAEFANYRRREEQRRQQVNQDIRASMLMRLLPVLDDLERAFLAIPEEAQGSPWVEGLALVGQKLQATLEKDGLSVMSIQLGDPFDPNYHEAVVCEPSAEYPEGQIVGLLQRGYKIGEDVLRPALVRVSSGLIQETDD
jgi:molecular chaperone GrpE